MQQNARRTEPHQCDDLKEGRYGHRPRHAHVPPWRADYPGEAARSGMTRPAGSVVYRRRQLSQARRPSRAPQASVAEFPRPAPVPPPAAARTKPAERGPAWVVTLADAAERQCGRRTTRELVVLMRTAGVVVSQIALAVLLPCVLLAALSPTVLQSIIIATFIVAGGATGARVWRQRPSAR